MINVLKHYQTERGLRRPERAVCSGVNIATEKSNYVNTVGFGDRFEYITKVTLYSTFVANDLQKPDFEKDALKNIQRELYADVLPELYYLAQNIMCDDKENSVLMVRDLIDKLEAR